LYNDGACPISNSCDFESVDLCGYVNDVSSNDFTWRRVQGNDLDTDHTYETYLGHYMIARATQVRDRTARLLSPVYPSLTMCVSFYYKIKGAIFFNIRTYALGLYNSKISFQTKSNTGGEWVFGQTTLSYTTPYQIVFEAIDAGPNLQSSSVQLDDIEVKYKPCQPVASCDFEDGPCGYTNIRTSDFNWIILDGYYSLNRNLSYIPTYDHTTGLPSGSFMYLDTNNKLINKKALLESEMISFNSDLKCLQFYLKTNQDNDATLNINMRNKNFGTMVTLYTAPKFSTNDWVLYEVQLPFNSTSSENIDYPYSIVFEGITGNNVNGKLGELALDDVYLYNGSCQKNEPSTQFNCQNGQMIDSNLVCDFKKDCINGLDERDCGSCNFQEETLCGYKEISIGSYKWIRTRNNSIETNLGLYVDHTYNNQSGYYMSVTTNTGASSGPAYLLSSVLQHASSTCELKFWTCGSNSASLNVTLLVDNQYKATLSRKAPSSLIFWTQTSIPLGRVFNQFQVAFQGQRKFTGFDYLTVDDVEFVNCALPNPISVCQQDELRCTRGNCVSMNRVCDFVGK
jgi:hypothetical protein